MDAMVTRALSAWKNHELAEKQLAQAGDELSEACLALDSRQLAEFTRMLGQPED